MKLFKALFSRKQWWVTLLVLLGMGVLGRLGIWQLDRLEERRAANAQLAFALSEAPFELTADFSATNPRQLKDRLVFAQGQYDFAYQGIIKLQNFRGQAGAHVVAPLVLADGETAVLVNRGWVPEAVIPQLSELDEPGGLTIKGYVGLSEVLSRAASEAAPADELAWFRLDIGQIQAQLPYRLLPVTIVEWSGEEETADLPISLERDIDLSEGPHLGYAIQWFAFTVMLGVGYVFFVRRKINE
jgi:surfeit locus 1 family protein